MKPAKLQVKWSQDELAAVIEAVSRARSDLRGHKEAWKQLLRADKSLKVREHPGARASLFFGEKSLSFLRIALHNSKVPAARSALARLEHAAQYNVRRITHSVTGDQLSTPSTSQTRGRRVRFVTGAQPPTR